MAKAVVPMERFRAKFGDMSGVGIAARIGEMAEGFLTESTHEGASAGKHKVPSTK
jgi:hypothetical protein